MDNHAFHTQGDYLLALDALIVQATRHIRIQDDDLRGQGWEAPARPALLEGFLRGDPARRVDILLRESGYLQGHCPHLMNLIRYRGHQLQVRLREETARAEECFVLADDGLLLLRYHRDGWNGRYAVDDRLAATQLGGQFADEWDRLQGGLGYQPLGL